MVETSKKRRRIGRPPAGARDGEKVKDYPQLSIRLPADVKATLQALSSIGGQPQWRLVTESIACFLRSRPAAEQRMVQDLARRTLGRRPRTKTRRS